MQGYGYAICMREKYPLKDSDLIHKFDRYKDAQFSL